MHCLYSIRIFRIDTHPACLPGRLTAADSVHVHYINAVPDRPRSPREDRVGSGLRTGARTFLLPVVAVHKSDPRS